MSDERRHYTSQYNIDVPRDGLKNLSEYRKEMVGLRNDFKAVRDAVTATSAEIRKAREDKGTKRADTIAPLRTEAGLRLRNLRYLVRAKNLVTELTRKQELYNRSISRGIRTLQKFLDVSSTTSGSSLSRLQAPADRLTATYDRLTARVDQYRAAIALTTAEVKTKNTAYKESLTLLKDLLAHATLYASIIGKAASGSSLQQLLQTVKAINGQIVATNKSMAALRKQTAAASGRGSGGNRGITALPTSGRNSFPLLTRQAGLFNRQLQETGFTFRRLLGLFATFEVIRRGLRLAGQTIRESFLFEGRVEESILGIGSIITATSDVLTAQGKSVSNADKLTLAIGEAARQTEILKKEAQKTAATFDTLVQTFQIGIGPGLSAGLNLDQVRELTVRISQAASAIALPQNQLSEEIRSILTGAIQQRTTRIAAVLGIENEDIRRAKRAGELFAFLKERFDSFGVAGERALDTITAKMTNVQDATLLLLGAMSTDPIGKTSVFKEFKALLDDIQFSIANINPKTGLIEINPLAIRAVRGLRDALFNLVSFFRELKTSIGISRLIPLTDALSSMSGLLKTLLLPLMSDFIDSMNFLINAFRRVRDEALQFFEEQLGISLTTEDLINGFRKLVVGVLVFKAMRVVFNTTVGPLLKIVTAVATLAPHLSKLKVMLLGSGGLLGGIGAFFGTISKVGKKFVIFDSIASFFTDIQSIRDEFFGGGNISIISAIQIFGVKIVEAIFALSRNIVKALSYALATAVPVIIDKFKEAFGTVIDYFEEFLGDKISSITGLNRFLVDMILANFTSEKVRASDKKAMQEAAAKQLKDLEFVDETTFKPAQDNMVKTMIQAIADTQKRVAPSSEDFTAPFTNLADSLRTTFTDLTATATVTGTSIKKSFSDRLKTEVSPVVVSLNELFQKEKDIMEELRLEAIDLGVALSAPSLLQSEQSDALSERIERDAGNIKRVETITQSVDQFRTGVTLANETLEVVRDKITRTIAGINTAVAAIPGLNIGKDIKVLTDDYNSLSNSITRSKASIDGLKKRLSLEKLEGQDPAILEDTERSIRVAQTRLRAQEASLERITEKLQQQVLIAESLGSSGIFSPQDSQLLKNASDNVIQLLQAQSELIKNEKSLEGALRAQAEVQNEINANEAKRTILTSRRIKLELEQLKIQKTAALSQLRLEQLRAGNRQTVVTDLDTQALDVFSEMLSLQLEITEARNTAAATLLADTILLNKADQSNNQTEIRSIAERMALFREQFAIEEEGYVARQEIINSELALLKARRDSPLATGFSEGVREFIGQNIELSTAVQGVTLNALNGLSSALTDVIAAAVDPNSNVKLGDAISALGISIGKDLVQTGLSNIIASTAQGLFGFVRPDVIALQTAGVTLNTAAFGLNTAAVALQTAAASITTSSTSGGVTGFIRGFFATGGPVTHNSRSRRDPRDTIPAMLRPNEWVIRPEAVKKYGHATLAALNEMRLPADIAKTLKRGTRSYNINNRSFASGGPVGGGGSHGGPGVVVLVPTEEQMSLLVRQGSQTLDGFVKSRTRKDR